MPRTSAPPRTIWRRFALGIYFGAEHLQTCLLSQRRFYPNISNLAIDHLARHKLSVNIQASLTQATASLHQALQQVPKAVLQEAKTALAIPYPAIQSQPLSLPAKRAQAGRFLDDFELDDCAPLVLQEAAARFGPQADQWLFDWYSIPDPQGNSDSLDLELAAVRETTLAPYLAAVQRAGLKPRVVDSDHLAFLRLARFWIAQHFPQTESYYLIGAPNAEDIHFWAVHLRQVQSITYLEAAQPQQLLAELVALRGRGDAQTVFALGLESMQLEKSELEYALGGPLVVIEDVERSTQSRYAPLLEGAVAAGLALRGLALGRSASPPRS